MKVWARLNVNMSRYAIFKTGNDCKSVFFVFIRREAIENSLIVYDTHKTHDQILAFLSDNWSKIIRQNDTGKNKLG